VLVAGALALAGVVGATATIGLLRADDPAPGKRAVKVGKSPAATTEREAQAPSREKVLERPARRTRPRRVVAKAPRARSTPTPAATAARVAPPQRTAAPVIAPAPTAVATPTPTPTPENAKHPGKKATPVPFDDGGEPNSGEFDVDSDGP